MEQESHAFPLMDRSIPLLQIWPSKVINCSSVCKAQCLTLEREGRKAIPPTASRQLLHPAPFTPLQKPPGQSSANSTVAERSCTFWFWHLFIIKDNLTWMAGEMAHLFLKTGFNSFSRHYACAEWCFKNIPRHGVNTAMFPYSAGQGYDLHLTKGQHMVLIAPWLCQHLLGK